jgi:hypothetical protein
MPFGLTNILQWCARPASTPPLEKYYFASVRGLASNRSERPCLAARTLLLADFAMPSSAVSWSLSNIVHEVFTRTISPNFISNCRNSFVFAFCRPQRGDAVKREGRARASFPWPTKAILQGNHQKVLACRHMRSLQLLCTVGGDLASSRTEAK